MLELLEMQCQLSSLCAHINRYKHTGLYTKNNENVVLTGRECILLMGAFLLEQLKEEGETINYLAERS